jgi:hypothetical protein
MMNSRSRLKRLLDLNRRLLKRWLLVLVSMRVLLGLNMWLLKRLLLLLLLLLQCSF